MNIVLNKPALGLDGVPAAATALSLVDGEAGRLVIAGLDVEHLVATHDFEAAARRLWSIADPAAAEAPPLGALREQAFEGALALAPLVRGLGPVEGLRAMLAALDVPDGPTAHVAITAAVPVLASVLEAVRDGVEPIEPDASLGHAEDALRMLLRRAVSAAEARALDAYLTTVIDHGMNASTFATRVVIATRASLVSAVTAGYGALTGPLHGGAPGPVLDMLDEVGTAGRARPWIDVALDKGDRLMGFGHRIYRVRDPRADVLKAQLQKLAPETARLSLAMAVEDAARAALAEKYPGRRLDTNVEFFTALLLDALGLKRHLFTPLFAMGRVAGWTAHALEHHARKGRLIRPDALYDGAMPD